MHLIRMKFDTNSAKKLLYIVCTYNKKNTCALNDGGIKNITNALSSPNLTMQIMLFQLTLL